MKPFLAWLALAFLMFASHAAPAASSATKVPGGPAPGLWWNPAESGRGYNFDLQGNLLVMTTYVYTAQGAPTWYLSVGTYGYSNGTMQASFDGNSGGQCFGCAYKAPTGSAGAGGPMKVIFDNAVSGTLYFNGGSTKIQRQIFGFANFNAFLFGEIQMAYNIGGAVGGDWFLFASNYTATDGTVYVAGNLDGCTSCAVLGRYDTTLKAWTMIDKVGSYYTFYKVDMDDRRVFGQSWIYQTTLSGNGTVSLGSRVLAKEELSAALLSPPNGAALRTASDAEFIARREPMLADLAARQASGAVPVPAEILAASAKLQQMLDAH